MSTQPDLPPKDPAKDLKNFARQPAKKKEIELMADQAEKSTGSERVESDRKIRAKAGTQDKERRT